MLLSKWRLLHRTHVGAVVEVYGLINRPELNGNLGIVMDLDADRYILDMILGGRLKFKPSNLRTSTRMLGAFGQQLCQTATVLRRQNAGMV